MLVYLRRILFCLGSLLIIDGGVLILCNKTHLGTIIPVLLGLIFVGHALFWSKLHAILALHQGFKRFWQLSWLIFAVWLCSFIAFITFLSVNSVDTAQLPPVKAIIVLGGGIEHDQPSATLAKRLDRAAGLSQQQPQAWLLVSGGVGFGQHKSEAQIMSSYLQRKHHLDANKILLEEKSTSTELNLKNSRPILAAQHILTSDHIAIVTSDFHTLRANAIAKKQGYQHVYMLAATTPVSIRYNSWLREYFAFISGWILDEY